LLIMLNQCEEAIEVLDSIINNKYKGESITISEVISYNRACLKKNSTHVQSNFIIGTLIYKKLGKPLEAYEKLDEFVQNSSEKVGWKLLRDRAQLYLNEIDKIIGVEAQN